MSIGGDRFVCGCPRVGHSAIQSGPQVRSRNAARRGHVKIKTAGEAAWLEAAWLRLGLTGIKQLSSQPGFGITTAITTVEFRPCLAKPIVPSHFRQTLMQIIGISHHHMLDIFAAFISYPPNWTFLATTITKREGFPCWGHRYFILFFFYICLLLLKGFEPGEVTAKRESGRRGNPPNSTPRSPLGQESVHEGQYTRR